MKLVNPQAGLAFDIEGTDSHQLGLPPAPEFLGEQVAISLLRDKKHCYNEHFERFTFTKFDGTTITV